MSARGVLRIREDGFAFWCLGCQEPHGVTHGWKFNGDYERPTFSPSILVTSGHYATESAAAKAGHCYCNWKERFGTEPPFRCSRCHSFVRDGQIQFLTDCTHELAGKTVPLDSFDDAMHDAAVGNQ